MVETFRPRKSIKYLGMVLSAIFLAAIVGYASIFFLDDPAKHGFNGKHSVAIVGGMGLVVFGSMLFLSAYIWAGYYVDSFTISGTTLSKRSIFHDHQFDVSELQSLTWRSRSNRGSIVFHGIGTKSRLDLDSYSNHDRLQIITALRDLVPTAIQEGWPNFCHKVALPLRDGRSAFTRRQPATACITITRRRYDHFAAMGIPLAIVVAVALWAWRNIWQLFALPPLLIAAWLLLRFAVPPDGLVKTRLTATSLGRTQLVGWGTLVGAQFLIFGLLAGGVEKSTARLIGGVLMGMACVPMFYQLHQADKEQRIADEQAELLAPDEWRHGQSKQSHVPS